MGEGTVKGTPSHGHVWRRPDRTTSERRPSSPGSRGPPPFLHTPVGMNPQAHLSWRQRLAAGPGEPFGIHNSAHQAVVGKAELQGGRHRVVGVRAVAYRVGAAESEAAVPAALLLSGGAGET